MKWVGKSIPKIDGVAIATGKPLYTEDLVVPGTLTVKLLCTPLPGSVPLILLRPRPCPASNAS
jgi:CO/xanthine dehydrogenase Mo-binding subunit